MSDAGDYIEGQFVVTESPLETSVNVTLDVRPPADIFSAIQTTATDLSAWMVVMTTSEDYTSAQQADARTAVCENWAVLETLLWLAGVFSERTYLG